MPPFDVSVTQICSVLRENSQVLAGSSLAKWCGLIREYYAGRVVIGFGVSAATSRRNLALKLMRVLAIEFIHRDIRGIFFAALM